MSINVTVTGNPVCVRRGKMVTTTTSGGAPRDVVDEEFDRRRLLRLEQVRQQSRDIAEGVRQKVRKEKRRQLGELEREGKEELRRSQNRRLLELQTQYREGLRELGAGHREAEKENDMERQLARRRESEQRDAARRGNEAAAALLRPTEKEPTEPKQKRPQPVVKTHKKKKKKVVAPTTTTTTTRHVSKKRRGATADINITVPGTDTDDEATEATEASSSKTEEASTSDVESSSGASPRRPPEATPIERRSGPCLSPVEECPSNTPRVSDDRQPSSPAKTSLERFLRDLAGPPDLPEPDTRISERIRRRSLVPPEPEPERPVPDKRRCSCGKFSRIMSNQLPINQPTKDIREPQRCHCELRSRSVQVDEEKVVPPDGSRDKLRSRSVQVEKEESTVESELNRRRCPCDKPVEMRSRSVQVEEERRDLPQLPEVDVRTSSETFKSGSGASKVQFYDHASRTRTERRVPIDSYLERNITPAPHVQSESLPRDNPSDCCEEAKRRRDARARFRNALERDRISKDYEEMLRRLPLLERRERVAGIGGDRQEHHMAERRAKEVERRRQNAMENEYAQTFRRPVVTVPRRQAEGPAGWDEERPPAREESLGEPKIFTANEVQEIVKAFTGRNVDERRRKLRELLESLKLQKEELVREIRKIPADDSVNELIRDLDSVIVEGDRDKDGKKRSRRRRRRSTGDSSTSSSSSSELRTKGRKERKRDTSKVVRTISTQTSDDRTVCTELHVPCDCKPELCEIVIQVRDDKKVKASGPPQDEEEKQPADDVIPEKRSVAVGTDSIPPVRSTSHGRWRDSLVRNSFSTTSTSYRSPPDFRKFTGRCGGTKTNLSSLVPIVERLLSMSRTSVDELSVSTASSVATPSRSVVDVAANHPERDRLEEVVRYFAARTAEVPHALSVSPDVPYVPPNTTDTSRAPSADSRESLMRQYAEITESCSRRIQNLTDMIRRLRDEKDEMLCKAQCDGTTNNNTSSSVDEDELYRKITEIDMELAAKLKGMKESNRDAVDTMKRLTDPDSSNVEMIARLERLRDPPTSTSAFVPFLSDVPKLPKFEPIPPPNNNDGNLQHRRPPPSKGLDRLTDEPLVPHELSTIAEADSQALPDIPEEEERPPPKESAPTTASDTLEDVLRDMGMAWAIPTVAKTKEAAAMTSSSSERFASLLTNSSSGGSSEMKMAQAQTSAQAPPRTSTPLTSDKSPSMAFSDSSSISFVKRSSNDS